MMAGMVVSLSGLVSGAPELELCLCVIAFGFNHRQPQVSLQKLLFSKVLSRTVTPDSSQSYMSTPSY